MTKNARVKTGLRAGAPYDNHDATRGGLRVQAGVRAGLIDMNHNQG